MKKFKTKQNSQLQDKKRHGSQENKTNSETEIKKWINNLPPNAFIDRSTKYHVEKSILDELPLLPYNETKWKKLFNVPPNSDYTKLQLTEVGTYSIAQPDISAALVEFIKEVITKMGLDQNTVTITETNGGLGGFSSVLLKDFNNLNIVELNPTHYKIIQNNLQIYGYDNDPTKKVVIYEGDYLNKMLDLTQQIIIADLPWGGRGFIKQPSVRLGFSNIDVTNVINFLNDNDAFVIFIFLAPVNYNFNMFLSQIKTKDIYIRKVRRHNFVCVYGKG